MTTPASPIISLPNGNIVPGTGPLVLIGPNGVGKTRFGTNLVDTFRYDRIPALRTLSFKQAIPVRSAADAKREADDNINQTRANPWAMANELTNVLAEMKADDAQYATEYRNRAEQLGTYQPPIDTGLKTLVRIWKMVFPGRDLDLSTYEPKARWDHGVRPTAPYDANQMSDGERSALYLITRILRAKSGVVVIDEPEVHFHALLARAFWDLIETERSDCRFVYITHDIPFALSRSNARIGIVRSEKDVELVPENAPIPAHLFESILGAASLSVVANRIVFCEGKYDRSVDVHLYTAWFRSPATIVVPVGSCADVLKSVEVFAQNPAIANAVAIGIVERDYWPDEKIAALRSAGLVLLPTHEIEGLLCIRAVAAAVAKHLAINNFDMSYSNFESSTRRHFVGIALHKQILERAKRRIDVAIVGLPNRAHPKSTIALTRSALVEVVDLGRAVPDVGAVFDAESTRVQEALKRPAEDFLAILPGKDCLDLLCRELGVTKDRYRELIKIALELPDGDKSPLANLREDVVAALSGHLPPR